MNVARSLVFTSIITLLLAACTSPGDIGDATPGMSVEETGQVAEAMATDMQALEAGLAGSASFQALAYAGSFSTGATYALEAQGAPRPLALASVITTLAADISLDRGIYVYNDATYGWDDGGASDDLVARWSFVDGDGASRNAEAVIDWDVSTGTVEAVDPAGTTSELPRDARATLELDGVQVASFDFDAAWRSTTCGTTTQPTSMALNGSIGDSAGEVALEDLTLSLGEDGRVSTSGDVTGTAGTAHASFGWDIDLDGSFDTDASGCFWTGYDVTSGSAQVSASTTNHSLVFGFDFGNLVYDEFDNVVAVDLANGSFRVDGETALTFSGTLDDQDGDGIYGDRLTLVFADETITLEAFLARQESMARAGAALKALGLLR